MDKEKSAVTRRKFLAASAAGLVSAGFAGLSPGLGLAQEAEKAGGEIIHRTLGKTGLKVPVISHGSGGCNDASVIQNAYELGIRLFDTAANYQTGANEMLIGTVLKKMGVRDKAIILTKTSTPAQRRNVKPEQVQEKLNTLVDGSLKRLRTDYIDILLIHDMNSAEDANNPEAIAAMKQIKKDGKVRFIGVSTHGNMAEVLNAAAEAKAWDVVLTSINFTMADDKEFLAAVENAAQKGIGLIGMKTLAFGSPWPNPASRGNYDGNTVARALMKWVLHNKNIATIMPAMNNFQQLKADFPIAYDIEYSDDEKKLLVDNKIELSMGFCRQCGSCLASCPKDTDIPSLMRTHMYATRYEDFNLAQSALNEIEKNRGLKSCVSCGDCTASCAHTVDVKSRINDLISIYA